MSHKNRVVVLIDMDCFYCQVEEKLDPKLEGKPIAVVQYNAWRGGGIIAVNYPARDQGVTRYMRGDEAQKKCPDLILARVPNVRGKADLTKYRDAGKRVADVLQTFTKLLERASVDEAYLDITEEVEKKLQEGISDIAIQKMLNTFVVGYETAHFIENLRQNPDLMESDMKLAMGGVITEEIRAEVFKQTGYKCSAGVAHNKILAKLVCGLHKPNKQTILPDSSVPELYKDLPISKIKSLGGKFGNSIVDELQISFMGELIQFSQKELSRKFDDKAAKWLYNIARGIDLEPVTTRLISKSIGCCKKFPGKTALITSEDIEHWLNEFCEEISERLQKDLEENRRKAKQMVVSFTQKVDKKFVNSSRNHPLSSYEKGKIVQGAVDVIRRFCMKADGTYHLTFLGISVGNFQPLNNSKDISLFFKDMQNDHNKKKEETIKKSNSIEQNVENDRIKSSNANNNNQVDDNFVKEASRNTTPKTKNSFFEKFLRDHPEFSNSSAKSSKDKQLEENENYRDEKLDDNKPKANSFFEKVLNDNPEFSNSKNTGSDIHKMDCENDRILENIGTIEIAKSDRDELEEENCSVYSASTDELNEDTRHLIYFEDVFSESDCTKPIFRHNESNHDNPSTSKRVDDNRFAKSFFLNYLKTNGMVNMETRKSNKNNDQICEEIREMVDSDEDLFPSPIKESQVTSKVPFNPTDCDNQICPECNKKISNSEFVSHMDYHFALKIVKEEAHLYKNIEHPSRKDNNIKSDKKPGTKRKKISDSSSKSIVTFLQNSNDVKDNNSELCTECNKKIKLEDVAGHVDYHIARTLHRELNSNIQNSEKIATPINNTKSKKNKVAKNVRTISTFFKNDS